MGRTVLVVDDNPDVREGIADYLRLLGWQVATAADGSEALERMWSSTSASVWCFWTCPCP